jgi:hypothetical protein
MAYRQRHRVFVTPSAERRATSNVLIQPKPWVVLDLKRQILKKFGIYPVDSGENGNLRKSKGGSRNHRPAF